MTAAAFTNPLPEVLRRRAEDEPERLACAFLPGDPARSSRTLTYRQLDRAARTVSGHLQGALEPGRRVLLVYPPGLDFLTAFVGCLYARILPATAYPPRPGQSLAAIRGILADCGAERVLTTASLAAHVEQGPDEGRDGLTVPLVATDRLAADAGDDWRDPGVAAEDLAFLQYTSGSTGDPKGVMVGHGNLLSTLTDVHRGFRHDRDSVMVSWLPTFHDMGLIYGVLLPFMVGFPTYLMAPVTFLRQPYRWLEAISRHRGTHTSAPNFGYQLCLRKISDQERDGLDLSSWRVAANGAEAVRRETQTAFLERFAPCGVPGTLFCPSYGLAEVGLKVATARRGEPMETATLDASALQGHRLLPVAEDAEGAQTLVACGRSEIGADIRIVDPESRDPRSDDRVGEIWVASTSVCRGYWGREELTEATFRAHTRDGEGPFLRTGDLGFLRDGQLYIAGRIKDLIVVRGRNYYSHDLERTVEEVDSQLRPGCGAAFGVEVAAEERLVVTQEVRADAQGDPDELIRRIRSAVTRQHGIKPHAVLLSPPGAIPKTSSGKLRRPRCRELYLAGKLRALAHWTAGPDPRRSA